MFPIHVANIPNRCVSNFALVLEISPHNLRQTTNTWIDFFLQFFAARHCSTCFINYPVPVFSGPQYKRNFLIYRRSIRSTNNDVSFGRINDVRSETCKYFVGNCHEHGFILSATAHISSHQQRKFKKVTWFSFYVIIYSKEFVFLRQHTKNTSLF